MFLGHAFGPFLIFLELPSCECVVCSLISLTFSFSVRPFLVILYILTILPQQCSLSPLAYSIFLHSICHHLTWMFTVIICLPPLDCKFYRSRDLVCFVSQLYSKVPCLYTVDTQEKFECWMNFWKLVEKQTEFFWGVAYLA